ncbi:DUF2059 domain-containing protein [Neisseria sp. DTU_2021_1001991_1_SI_NGA_ILE_055]|uniref:DUF2059 domain-containing protein n=1 Tax=Neisseria sp. DTU_2021_1001991_1_SI_NGA_ILE_055 TaxID=3077590 RepID=UPI0028E85B6C|nr:DUF2059 domain-containing protein [Neisseria sp. DTU_2021_1001991_1_SI_NGA_ILE_055]WNS84498.1 DUF2059 domain-containing protein [Neisseria sp. DTU_2021_1001991_1_SI_NGA_ILE_055]
MKLKTLLLPFAVLVLCANAFAATPSDESLERWLDTQFFDRELEKNMIDGFNVGFKPYADKALAKVPEAKKEQMAKAIDRYRENVLRDLITPEVKQTIRNNLLKNAKLTYTQEEVDGMIAFNSSPVGQAVVVKTPFMLNQAMNELMTFGLALTEKVAQRHMPEFAKEMQGIMCGGKKPDTSCKQAKQVGKKHKK